jgi:hypothetical protein
VRYFLPVVLIASFFTSCAKGSETSVDDLEETNHGSGSASGGAGGSGSGSGVGGEGSECPADDFEPNETCAAASKVGVVTDANDTAITLTGTLTSGSDQDWFTFDTTDTDEVTGNSYHVSIAFDTNTAEFAFDVVRGDKCAEPAADHANLTSYTWCVDGSAGSPDAGLIGERDCGKFDGGTGNCTDHSTPYFVRVHRKSGYSSEGSCATYHIKVTGKGGTACDFTQSCDPQGM